MRLACISRWAWGTGCLLALTLTGAALGCGTEPDEQPDASVPQAGFGPTPDGGEGGAPGDGGTDGGASPEAGVAAPVLIGLAPNPRTDEAGQATVAAELDALLTVKAVGARVLSVVVPWDLLERDGLGPLLDSVATARASGLAAWLTVAPVDRLRDRRPPQLATLNWDDDAVIADMCSLLDAVVSAVGDEVAGVLVGQEVDVYGDASPAPWGEFATFVTETVAHLRASTGNELPVGAGLSFFGPAPSERWRLLLEPGNVVAVTYHPGIAEAELPAANSVAKDLDTLIALGAGRPVVLTRVGLTTNPSSGGSEQSQLGLLDGLFSALLPRRASVPVVCIHELHDRTAAGCEALADMLGVDADSAEASYLCRTGLRTVDGLPKPAWDRFMQGAAAFASP